MQQSSAQKPILNLRTELICSSQGHKRLTAADTNTCAQQQQRVATFIRLLHTVKVIANLVYDTITASNTTVSLAALQELSSLYALRVFVETKLAYSASFAASTTALDSSTFVRLRLTATTATTACCWASLKAISTIAVTVIAAAVASASDANRSRRVLCSDSIVNFANT
jgi:hypothetical protein